MKRMTVLCLAAVMLLCFAACGQEQNNDVPQITIGVQQPGNQEATGSSDTTESTQPTAAAEAYAFSFNGIQLVPGTAFDASKLPAATSTYQVPSCALEGTDNVYNYDTFEVTAFNDGKSEYIYSIYFIDPNLTTPEGLAQGDTLDKAVSLYGSGYTQADSAYTYESAGTQLILIVQDGSIVSIEYRMVTE